MEITACILAAGMGTRMGVGEDGKPIPIHKSLRYIPRIDNCTLDYNIRHLVDSGVHHIVIVVGAYSDQIRKFINLQDYGEVDIELIYNEHYSDSGCNYSLSHVIQSKVKDELIIIEADTIYPDDAFTNLINSSTDNNVLCRSAHYIDVTKSVIITRDGELSRFIYDPEHKDVTALVGESEEIVAESLQVWNLKGDALEYFLDELEIYKVIADGSGDRDHSGVETLNEISRVYKLNTISTDYPDKWFNINTEDDIW